jgi:hypothetical protein
VASPLPRASPDNWADYFKKPDLKHDAARYAASISKLLGDKYVPERIKELLAAEQTSVTGSKLTASTAG